ncbi:MAG: transposase [Candidatus Kryptoniota bacterium]
MNRIREKSHRLQQENYVGFVDAAFSACTRGRVTGLTNICVYEECKQALISEAKFSNCKILVYLFMPDHCHFVLEGASEEADLLHAVYMFKQKTGYWFSKNFKAIAWQKDFYDHILRKDEDAQKHVKYILGNPVRNGIVDEWKDYEFKGSTVLNLGEWI